MKETLVFACPVKLMFFSFVEVVTLLEINIQENGN
jgi:hypothetical protein